MKHKKLRDCPQCMITLTTLVVLWSLFVWVTIGRWRDHRRG